MVFDELKRIQVSTITLPDNEYTLPDNEYSKNVVSSPVYHSKTRDGFLWYFFIVSLKKEDNS